MRPIDEVDRGDDVAGKIISTKPIQQRYTVRRRGFWRSENHGSQKK